MHAFDRNDAYARFLFWSCMAFNHGAILTRRHCLVALKDLTKIGRVVKSAVKRYLGNAHTLANKQKTRTLHAQAVHIFDRCAARVFSKEATKILLVGLGNGGKRAE